MVFHQFQTNGVLCARWKHRSIDPAYVLLADFRAWQKLGETGVAHVDVVIGRARAVSKRPAGIRRWIPPHSIYPAHYYFSGYYSGDYSSNGRKCYSCERGGTHRASFWIRTMQSAATRLSGSKRLRRYFWLVACANSLVYGWSLSGIIVLKTPIINLLYKYKNF